MTPKRKAFTLRMPTVLRRRLAKAAKAAGVSLNEWMVINLEREIDRQLRVANPAETWVAKTLGVPPEQLVRTLDLTSYQHSTRRISGTHTGRLK